MPPYCGFTASRQARPLSRAFLCPDFGESAPHGITPGLAGLLITTSRMGSPETPKMTPDKDPTFWAEVSRVLSNPLWQGAIMAATISLLRVLYDAKETKVWRVILESLICGGLSLSASSIIKWMDWPEGLSVAAGGMIGFLGVTAIREFAMKFIGKKVETL